MDLNFKEYFFVNIIKNIVDYELLNVLFLDQLIRIYINTQLQFQADILI